jgi:small GTP-binding protein
MFGSGAVGKSSITMRYCQDYFSSIYDPTIEDQYRKIINLDGQNYYIEILDSSGTEQFSHMREYYIKDGDGFVLVYSIVSRSTFADVDDFYSSIGRIKEEDDETFSCLLVANKLDLDSHRRVSTQEGLDKARIMNCPFIEVSAKNNINVNQLFETILRQIINQWQTPIVKKKKICYIL